MNRLVIVLIILSLQLINKTYQLQQQQNNSDIEHVYSVNERETISLKCPIDFNNQPKFLSNDEFDQLGESNSNTFNNNDEIYDYSEDLFESTKRTKRDSTSYPIIIWYKDAAKIENNQNQRYSSDGLYLKIKHVNVLDSAKFKCVILSESGKNATSNLISLVVLKDNLTSTTVTTTAKKARTKSPSQRKQMTEKAPQFMSAVKSQPKSFQKQRGEQVRFRCRATGSPRPNIIWYKNGDLLSQEDYGITK
jgi:hypothetical protein